MQQTEEAQPADGTAAADVPSPDGQEVTIPGFTVTGHLTGVAGEWVGVFEYPTVEAAEADKVKVSPDGKTVDGQPVGWTAPVHYFHHGQVIAVYMGTSDSVIQTLTQSGPQFAGD